MNQPLIPFALRLLSQHVALIYPVLLFSLLIDGLKPDNQWPALEWRWLVLFVLLLLLKAAFTCGWYGSICAAVQDAMTRMQKLSPAGDAFVKQADAEPETPPRLWPKTFQYFGAFLPAIGRYFVPIALGEVSITLLQLGLIVAGLWYGMQTIGLPNSIQQLAHVQNSQQITAWVSHLTVMDQLRLEQFSWLLLAVFAGLAVLQALLQFWVFFVLLLQQNPFTALFKSLGFSLKNALALIVQFLPILLVFGCFFLLSLAHVAWLAFVGMMGATLTMLLLLLMSTSFFYQRFPQANLLPLDEGKNGPVASGKSIT